MSLDFATPSRWQIGKRIFRYGALFVAALLMSSSLAQSTSKTAPPLTNRPAAVTNRTVTVSRESILRALRTVVTNQSATATITNHPAAIINRTATVTNQPAAVAHQLVAVTNRPATVTNQPVAVANRPAAVSNPSTAVTNRPAIADRPAIVANWRATLNKRPAASTNRPTTLTTSVTDRPATMATRPTDITNQSAPIILQTAATTVRPPVVTNQPASISNRPAVVANRPTIVTNQPVAVANRPAATTNLAAAVIDRPKVVINPPPAITQQSPAVVDQPEAIPNRPTVVANRPATATNQPVAVAHQSAAITDESTATIRQPPVVIDEPAAITIQPAVVANKPPTVTNQPVTVTHQSPIIAEPAAIRTQPVAITTQPIAITPQPAAISEQQPAAATTQLAAVTDEPAAVVTQPIATTHQLDQPEAVPIPLAAVTNPPAVTAPSQAIADRPTAVPDQPAAVTNQIAAVTTQAIANTNLTSQNLSRLTPPLLLNDTSGFSTPQMSEPGAAAQLRSMLEDARHLRLMRQPTTAEPILESLLTEGNPEPIQQSALLELALVAQDENNLVRAEQIYAQFVARWSSDKRIPEIYLHQGQLFRQMGLNSLAFAKFYSVMTSALAVKNDQLDYYQKLVLDAQMEIAETHYQSGRFNDAADFFSRLLKQNNPALNRQEIQFRLIRSLQATGNHTETAAQAFDFLSRFPNSPNQPEVRFCLALALKELGRTPESLQQVLALLKEEKDKSKDHPEVWAYWQQRTGNEIANQLYRDGDYPKALDIYLSLLQLDRTAAWQLPLKYQIGMTYERLLQPDMATQSYSNIVTRQTDLGTNASPGLKAIVEMAQWRIKFIQWQSHADNVNHALAESPSKKRASKKPASATTAIP
jgi:tetratricopeptide (TPR) repeat protein